MVRPSRSLTVMPVARMATSTLRPRMAGPIWYRLASISTHPYLSVLRVSHLTGSKRADGSSLDLKTESGPSTP